MGNAGMKGKVIEEEPNKARVEQPDEEKVQNETEGHQEKSGDTDTEKISKENKDTDDGLQKVPDGPVGKRVSFQVEEKVKKRATELLGTDVQLHKFSLVGQDGSEDAKPGFVLVDQIYEEPIEEFDVAFKDDLSKMKDMGLPLGFLNVSPFEVDENKEVKTVVDPISTN